MASRKIKHGGRQEEGEGEDETKIERGGKKKKCKRGADKGGGYKQKTV